MKLICETQKLSEICSNVQRAVSTKSSIPAIEGILLEAGENVLTLTGYDLEVGMITSMEARVEEAGSIILNAKILCDLFGLHACQSESSGRHIFLHPLGKSKNRRENAQKEPGRLCE